MLSKAPNCNPQLAFTIVQHSRKFTVFHRLTRTEVSTTVFYHILLHFTFTSLLLSFDFFDQHERSAQQQSYNLNFTQFSFHLVSPVSHIDHPTQRLSLCSCFETEKESLHGEMGDSFENGLSKWCQMTSFHGIIDWFESKGFIKTTLWTVSNIRFTGCCYLTCVCVCLNWFPTSSLVHIAERQRVLEILATSTSQVSCCAVRISALTHSAIWIEPLAIAIGMTMENDCPKLDPGTGVCHR